MRKIELETIPLKSEKQPSSGGTIDFGQLSNVVVQRAVAIGESFFRNVTLTKEKLRKITDQKSSEFKHSLFQQQSQGVNFINILLSTFLYKSVLRSFSLITVWLCNFLAQEYQEKSCS